MKISLYFTTKHGTVDIEEVCPKEKLTDTLLDLLGSMKIAVREMKEFREELDDK